MSDAYKNVLATRAAKKAPTPQSKPIPGREEEMAKNNAGGYTFTVDIWTRLDRFLILGTEGGTYYVSQKKLTIDNASAILSAIKQDGIRVVNRIVEISDSGRAPKNDPVLFALALTMTHGDAATKRAAYDAISKVARIGTHILHLADYVNGMRGWGRGLRGAFGAWYNNKTPMQLAQQLTKYANRDGWTHADIIKLAHIHPASQTHDALFSETMGHAKNVDIDLDVAEYMSAIDQIKRSTDVKEAVKLIEQFKLPREVIPTEFLNKKEVWASLLPHMGMESMVRNLATMTRVGLLAPMSEAQRLVIEKMSNTEAVQKSRIHPMKVLVGLKTYAAGHGFRGSNTWTPEQRIVDAMDDLFYAAFGNVTPTGKRTLLGLDISGSMSMGDIAGMIGISPRIASAAMAMVTARTEKEYAFIGFSTSTIRLPISEKMRLDEVVRKISNLPFGGTDCAQPMLWAKQNKIDVDAFFVYTDNETWAGGVQPSQALKKYREATGIAAKEVVVGMTATDFTIADPKDAGMMDIVGFDTAAPALMADFVRE
jgi:60 kDa SS-A/Ro ribonucleoprotein